MSVDEKMTAIADAIRGYGSITGKLNLDDMASKIGTVYLNGYDLGNKQGIEEGFDEGKRKGYSLGFEEGKIAERDNFWDIFQNYGEGGRVYNNAFSYGKFTDENYNPKYDIITSSGTTTSDQMFYRAVDITNIKVPMYINSSRFNNVFYGCVNLVSIPELHLIETTTYLGAFADCTALQTLNVFGTIGQNGFNVRWSTKLNKASIESIINALSATESGLTVTFSKTAVNNAFTAEEWEALEATKTNWTISLV